MRRPSPGSSTWSTEARLLTGIFAIALLACPRPPPVEDAGEEASALDGGCGAYGTAIQTGTTPEVLPELSGLAASRLHAGVFWAHNDSGNGFSLFALDEKGTVRGEWSISNASPPDVEDVAVGPCAPGESASCIFLGDIGDNANVRSSLALYRLPEPTELTRGGSLTVEALAFTYSDGPHDSEALVVHPRSGELALITKEWNGMGALYVLEGLAPGSTGSARRVAAFTLQRGTDRAVTAADVHPSGERLILRTYQKVYEARVEDGSSIETLAVVPLVALPTATQPQSEAIAYLEDGRGYLLGTEGAGGAIFRVSCR